ncbi:MAG: iron donor protein CyaY [Burkholderiales bacterium]|nr:iron donor protein CyaY [Burkholderiales bacterium]
MSAPTLQDTEYQAAAERVLAAIERQCDAWLQQGVIDIDTNRAGGLVELEFPNGSKIVVNKQPPLHEIWLAARNGGFHFKFSGQGWRDTRDGVDLFARLSDEASRQAGVALDFRGTP